MNLYFCLFIIKNIDKTQLTFPALVTLFHWSTYYNDKIWSHIILFILRFLRWQYQYIGLSVFCHYEDQNRYKVVVLISFSYAGLTRILTSSIWKLYGLLSIAFQVDHNYSWLDSVKGTRQDHIRLISITNKKHCSIWYYEWKCFSNPRIIQC